MANSTGKKPIEWQNANFEWNDSLPYTWSDVGLIQQAETLEQPELDALDKKKKQRLVKLIMRLDGVKIYDEFKKPSEAVLTVKNVELLVEDVKATIRGFKHESK